MRAHQETAIAIQVRTPLCRPYNRFLPPARMRPTRAHVRGCSKRIKHGLGSAVIESHVERRPQWMGPMSSRPLSGGCLWVGAAIDEQPHDSRVVYDALVVGAVPATHPGGHGSRRPVQRCPALCILVIDHGLEVNKTCCRCLRFCYCRPWRGDAQLVEHVAVLDGLRGFNSAPFLRRNVMSPIISAARGVMPSSSTAAVPIVGGFDGRVG